MDKIFDIDENLILKQLDDAFTLNSETVKTLVEGQLDYTRNAVDEINGLNKQNTQAIKDLAEEQLEYARKADADTAAAYPAPATPKAVRPAAHR